MKVLMFGWEFPPYSSGGLGTACYGLTKSLSKFNIDITFIVPYYPDEEVDFLNLLSTNVKIRKVYSILKPYITSSLYMKQKKARYGNITMSAFE